MDVPSFSSSTQINCTSTMEKYPPNRDSPTGQGSSGRAVPGTVRYSHSSTNSKLREKAERSVARQQSQQEAERRRLEAERHATVARLTVVWRDEIIPNWAEFEKSTRVRKLVAEGIPTSVRGIVWPLLIGNKAQVTIGLYEESKREAFRVKQLSADREVVDLDRERSVRFAAEETKLPSPTESSMCVPSSMIGTACIEGSPTDSSVPPVTSMPYESGSSGIDTVAAQPTEESHTDNRIPSEYAMTSDNVINGAAETEDECHQFENSSSIHNPSSNTGCLAIAVGSRVQYATNGEDVTDTPNSSRDTDVDLNREDGGVEIEDLTVDASVDLLRVSVSERGLSSRVQTVSLIQWDLTRTFPTLSFFNSGAPLNQSLENVLMAYAAYRPDVGYVQGMSFLVAIFLLQMDEYTSFQCLVNLMKSRNQLEFYRLNFEAVTSFSEVFNYYFLKYLPLLYHHFNEQGMAHTMFLVDWNLTIFSKALPLECAIRIWDSYLVEGEVFVLRAAIGLLRLYAPRLSQMDMETIAPFLMRLPEETSAASVFASISEIKISHSSYTSICHKFKFDSQEWNSGTIGRFHKLSNMLSPSQQPTDPEAKQKPISKRNVIRNFVSSFLPTKTPSRSTSTS